MDRIIIKDLLLRGILGLNPDERIKKQDILVNVVMYHDITKAGEADDVSISVNYKTITKRIIKRVEDGNDLTVEKLVLDIARMIIVEYGVERTFVRVEKPTALRFAASVGIEIERTRADFS
ncbi:MAG: dihydroneopterin aldolase [Candidatus Promineifilaceae bacterium]